MKNDVPVFDTANLTIQEAAKALGFDAQTVRVMIQQGVVEWGTCFKLPGSKMFIYMISPKLFYEITGYKKN